MNKPLQRSKMRKNDANVNARPQKRGQKKKADKRKRIPPQKRGQFLPLQPKESLKGRPVARRLLTKNPVMRFTTLMLPLSLMRQEKRVVKAANQRRAVAQRSLPGRGMLLPDAIEK